MSNQKHDYALIAKLIEDHSGWRYPALAEEYTKRSRIPITPAMFRWVVRGNKRLKAIKQPYSGGTKPRKYSYEVIEELILANPHLENSPKRLRQAYFGLTGVVVPYPSMSGILQSRRERLAREEAAKNGQDASGNPDYGFDDCGDPGNTAL